MHSSSSSSSTRYYTRSTRGFVNSKVYLRRREANQCAMSAPAAKLAIDVPSTVLLSLVSIVSGLRSLLCLLSLLATQQCDCDCSGFPHCWRYGSPSRKVLFGSYY